MPHRKHRRAPPLALVTGFFAMLGLIIFAGLLYATISERIRSYQVETLRRAVLSRSKGIDTVLADALKEDWQQLNALASTIPNVPAVEVGDILNFAAKSRGRIAWVSYTALDGRVVAASKAYPGPANLKDEPWFAGRLSGPLAMTMPQEDSGSGERRNIFAEYSMPVSNEKGRTLGIVTLALSQNWASAYIGEIAHSLDVDLLIVDSEGNLLLDTGGETRPDTGLASVRSAISGDQGLFVETWADGRRYFVETRAQTSAKGMPPLGLRIATRMPASVVASAERSLSDSFVFYLIAYGAMLALLAALFIVAYIRPFSRMARSALKVAKGSDVYPFESNRTKELQQIGAAITRLQMKLHSRPDGELERGD